MGLFDRFKKRHSDQFEPEASDEVVGKEFLLDNEFLTDTLVRIAVEDHELDPIEVRVAIEETIQKESPGDVREVRDTYPPNLNYDLDQLVDCLIRWLEFGNGNIYFTQYDRFNEVISNFRAQYNNPKYYEHIKSSVEFLELNLPDDFMMMLLHPDGLFDLHVRRKLITAYEMSRDYRLTLYDEKESPYMKMKVLSEIDKIINLNIPFEEINQMAQEEYLYYKSL